MNKAPVGPGELVLESEVECLVTRSHRNAEGVTVIDGWVPTSVSYANSIYETPPPTPPEPEPGSLPPRAP